MEPGESEVKPAFRETAAHLVSHWKRRVVSKRILRDRCLLWPRANNYSALTVLLHQIAFNTSGSIRTVLQTCGRPRERISAQATLNIIWRQCGKRIAK